MQNQSQFVNSPILSVDFNNKDKVIFNYDGKTVTIQAFGDCCSTSTLRPFNRRFDKLVGKTIVSVKEIFEKSNIYQSFLTEMDNLCKEAEKDGICLKIHLYQIKLSNGGSFYFYLENESNGYYDGYLTINGVWFQEN